MIFKKRIILIGNKSFIQQSFYKLFKNKFKIQRLKFEEINNFKFNQNDIVVNCSQDKNFFYSDYKVKIDRNLKIAKLLKSNDAQLVILSSRNVYKQKLGIKENSKIQPIDIYGRNCLKTENNCKKVLKKLTILRLSNVVGVESMKKKRPSLMSLLINGIRKNHIKFDDSYEWYKDLIPIRILCLYLEKILINKNFGVLNVGSGFKIKVKDYIKCLNLNKNIKITVDYNKIKNYDYSYNIQKLKKVTNINFSKELIIKEYNNIGKLISKL